MNPYPAWLLAHPQLTDCQRWTWLVVRDMQEAGVTRTNKAIGEVMQLTDVGARQRLMRMLDHGVVRLHDTYPQRWDALTPEESELE